MNARLIKLLALALVTGVFAGCSSAGPGVAEAEGFLQGLADGFLILVQFLGGYLIGSDSHFSLGTSYSFGYVTGAVAFLGLGTAFSAP